MKQYVIDELRMNDYEKIKAYMDMNFGSSGIAGLYQIPLDLDILNDVQKEHKDCQPFYFAVELEASRIACELLVRTNHRVRCDCIAYSDEKQRNWFIRLLDDIFEKLEIKT